MSDDAKMIICGVLAGIGILFASVPAVWLFAQWLQWWFA